MAEKEKRRRVEREVAAVAGIVAAVDLAPIGIQIIKSRTRMRLLLTMRQSRI